MKTLEFIRLIKSWKGTKKNKKRLNVKDTSVKIHQGKLQ